MSLLAFCEDSLKKAETAHALRKLRPSINHCLDFSTNDYLGLSTDDTLKESSAKLLHQEGFGSTGSRLLSGDHQLFHGCEAAMATFLSCEQTLLFNSGYQINVGVLPTLYSKGDLILSDRLCHASLLDGIQLSRAKHLRYVHNDMAHVKQLLATHRKTYKRAVLVTESVFSMDGDKAALSELIDLSRHYDCELYVDEAHAVGVFGPNGRGLTAPYITDIDFVVGTFGKAFGSYGAYIACKDVIKQYLINNCRSFIYSTALPLPVIAWNLAAIQKMPELEAKRKHLHTLSQHFKRGLEEKGFESPSDSQIVPAILHSNEKTVTLSNHLYEKGIIALPIRHPTVAKGQERLRFSVSAKHRQEDIDECLNAL